MKVFISWSGDVSHAVALALRDWLPSVLQSVDPYVSSEDIEKGARWSVEIGQQLEETSFGILCVTSQNLSSPWLNFEAGALSKSIDVSRVSPFLLDIRPAELVGPLSQFQATLPRLDDVIRLVKSINAVSERAIEETRITDAVRMWWPQLEEQLNTVAVEQDQVRQEPQRDTKEMVEELLEITRGIQRQLVRTGDEPKVASGVPYASRSEAARRARLVRTMIDVALSEALPEGSWEAEATDDGVIVMFDSAPHSILLRRINEIAKEHKVSVMFELPDFSGGSRDEAST